MSDYKELSMKEIQDTFNKYFGKENLDQTPLEDKLLPGYAYTIEGSTIKVNTGIGGVKLYIIASRDAGIPDWITAKSITVHTEQGPVTLDKVKVTKTNDSTTEPNDTGLLS